MHVSYSEVTWYAHDFLNQHTYWHFFKGREYLHAHSVIMEHIKFSHTCETSLVKLHKPITTLFFFFFEESNCILQSIHNAMCNLLFTPIHVNISVVEV